jgi:tetratricopeptide (TPR) repeat protein
VPQPEKSWRAWLTHPALWVTLVLACVAGGVGSLASGCSGWDPTEPFTRNAPDVDRALEDIDAGEYPSAEEALEDYLGTGPCGKAGIGLPQSVHEKHNASFDLGLVLFYLAEKYGQRFGDEEKGDAGPDAPIDPQRVIEIECAQKMVGAIAHDAKVPIDLRARAFYLAGNLEFMRREYEAAVKEYDQALELVPGLEPDADGDAIGSDTAWNRAIALRRIQEQDAGSDGGEDAEPDSGDDGGQDAEPDSGDDGGDDGGDQGNDGGGDDGGDDGGNQDQQPDAGGEDAGDDGGENGENDNEPTPEDEDSEPQSNRSQMERMLDELEEAPTYQEEDAKRNAAEARRRKVMEDK